MRKRTEEQRGVTHAHCVLIQRLRGQDLRAWQQTAAFTKWLAYALLPTSHQSTGAAWNQHGTSQMPTLQPGNHQGQQTARRLPQD